MPQEKINMPNIFYFGLLTLPGILGTLIVFFGINLIIFKVFIVRRDWSEYDDRGVTLSENGTYGTAGIANEDSIYQVFEQAKLPQNTKMILGMAPDDNKPLTLRDEVAKDFNGHVMLIGGSGRMKTRSLIMNEIFQNIGAGNSVVVTDPKGEIFAKTYAIAKNHDYDVKVFNIKDPYHSNTIDILGQVGRDISGIQTFVDTFINNTGGKNDPYWDNAAQNLLTALCLLVAYDDKRQNKTLAAVYDLIHAKTLFELSSLFRSIENVKINGRRHPALDNYHFFEAQTPEKKNSIIEGLSLRFQVFKDPIYLDLFSKSDIDLVSVGKKKTILYVIIEETTKTRSLILSLFFTFLITKLIKYADTKEDECLDVNVRCLLDEMANIGNIPDFPNWISYTRSRHIYFTCCFQDLGQIQDLYAKQGSHTWSSIISNCDIDIYYGNMDNDNTAKHYSAMAGLMTQRAVSTAEKKKAFSFNALQNDYRETEKDEARKVFNEDEIRGIKADECLIFIKGSNLTYKLKKFDYTGHPMSREIDQTHYTHYEGTNLNNPSEKPTFQLDDINLISEVNGESEVEKPKYDINPLLMVTKKTKGASKEGDESKKEKKINIKNF